MTKKERAYIEAKARKFESWALWERKQARKFPADRSEHLEQARLNECCASTLFNLLLDFEEGV